MKRFYTLLIMIWFGSYAAQANDTTTFNLKAIQQLYLGFGAGLTKTNVSDLEKHGNIFFSNLSLSFNKSVFFRGGYNFTRFNENLDQYPDLKSKGYLSPQHKITSYYLSIGKRKQLGNFFLIQATAGISYNRLKQPENIRSRPHYGPSLFGSSNMLDFEKVRQDKPGFIFQAEIMVADSLNYFGISLGSFIHYLPKATHGGLTLTLHPGLILRN